MVELSVVMYSFTCALPVHLHVLSRVMPKVYVGISTKARKREGVSYMRLAVRAHNCVLKNAQVTILSRLFEFSP